MTLDDSFVLGSTGSRILDESSSYHSRVNTSGMFGPYRKSLAEEGTIAEHLHKVSADSDRMMLTKQAMEVAIPGYHMMSSLENTSVGRVISLLVPKDQAAYQEDREEVLVDKKRSGKFLTTSVRHKIGLEDGYVAILELQRISSEDPLTDSEERPDFG